MEPEFGPIERVSASGVVRQRLLDWVLDRYAQGNVRLPPERVLAQELQVSRTTLRDALQSLSAIGVLESRQGSGWYVRENSGAMIDGLSTHFRIRGTSLEELIEVREIIEPTIASLAAQRRTTQELSQLERTYESMLEIDIAFDRFEQLDQEFHRGLAEASRNPYFSLILPPLLALLREKRIGVLNVDGALEASNRDHGAILQAVKEGKPKEAELAVRHHLRGFLRRARDPEDDTRGDEAR